MSKPKSIKMDHFFDVIEDFYEVFVISAGVTMGFNDMLLENKELTSKMLAEKTGYNMQMVEAWCNAAVACQYLKLENGKYGLQRWTKSYLTRKSPSNIGFLFEIGAVKMMLHPFLYQLDERFSGNHPEFEDEHVLAIPNTIKHYAPLITPMVFQSVQIFNSKCHVLDVGTGIGAYLMKFAELNPDLTGIGIDIQDLPIQEARKIAEEKNLADRLKFITMDAIKLSLDEKFDIIFVSNMIQALNHENARILVKKLYESLKEDGYIVILEMLINDDRISPKFGALINFYLKMEMLDAGTYSLNDLKTYLKEAGFTNPIINKQLMSQSYLIYTQK